MGLLLPNWEGVTSVPLWGPSPPLSPCPSQHTRWGHSLPAPRVGRRSEEVPGGGPGGAPCCANPSSRTGRPGPSPCQDPPRSPLGPGLPPRLRYFSLMLRCLRPPASMGSVQGQLRCEIWNWHVAFSWRCGCTCTRVYVCPRVHPSSESVTPLGGASSKLPTGPQQLLHPCPMLGQLLGAGFVKAAQAPLGREVGRWGDFQQALMAPPPLPGWHPEWTLKAFGCGGRQGLTWDSRATTVAVPCSL